MQSILEMQPCYLPTHRSREADSCIPQGRPQSQLNLQKDASKGPHFTSMPVQIRSKLEHLTGPWPEQPRHPMPPVGKPRLPVYSNGTLEESITNRTRGLHVSTVREERRPLVYMPVKKVSRQLLC